MTERYNVVSEGGIDAGYTIQQVQDNLCRIFKAPPAKIQKIFFSGSRSFVKRNVPYEEAVKYVAALKQAGAVTSLERIRDEQQTVSSENAALYAQDNPDQAGSDDPIEDEPPPDPLACPKCGYLAKSDRDPLTTSGQCPACGIVLAKYQALQAEMAEILLPEAQQLKEQILKVIKKALPQTGLYMIPDIPKEKLANAKRACNFPKNDELLGLLDCTAFGSAKECLVFGVRGLYMKDVPDFSLKDGKMSYAELARRQAPTSDGMFIVFGNNERLNRSGSSCPAGKIVAKRPILYLKQPCRSKTGFWKRCAPCFLRTAFW
ncbi:MAG: hypothetical protein CVU64_23655 [Deltaproteobacteria bacterium HGW-Deltaproteobacteria-21]|nr:MAG: hypothetical protein CVU64_23655 [Deltaproteobacteria bacterium HGW-Deltaproteobacteria-21]